MKKRVPVSLGDVEFGRKFEDDEYEVYGGDSFWEDDAPDPFWMREVIEEAQASWDVPPDWIPDDDVEPLGCGYYGCAYQTPVDGVILKVTSDPSEAAFAALALTNGGVPIEVGLVRYFAVYTLSGLTFRGRPLYALWREDVNPDLTAPHQVPGGNLAGVLLYKVIGTELRRELEKAPSAEDAFRALEWAQEEPLEVDDTQMEILLRKPRWAEDIADAYSSPHERFAIYLSALEWLEWNILNTYKVDAIGAALNWAREDLGVVLSDVHMGNIGWRTLRDMGEEWEQLVIFDPGHAVPLRPDVYEQTYVPPMPGLDGLR